jgi:predicted nuclease of predicted toxin-antitoxin system
VRVLLDANLPRGLARLLVGHEAHTVHLRRWSDFDDGALLDACAGEYSAFVTLDQSLPFQQNLRGRPIVVVVLRAHSNRLSDLEPWVPALLAALATAKAGEVLEVGVPRP